MIFRVDRMSVYYGDNPTCEQPVIFPGVDYVITPDGFKWKVELTSIEDLQLLHEAVVKEGNGRLALEVRFFHKDNPDYEDLGAVGSICIMDIAEI